jgi:Eukaryotic aspartyl protease
MRAVLLALVAACAPPPASPTRPSRSVEVPLTGVIGRYAGQFDIGGESVSLAVDTGSELVAVASPDCDACANDGATAYYSPGSHAVDLHDTWTSAYDRGQMGWVGHAYRDTVAAGALAAPITIYAMSDEAAMILKTDRVSADGIFGFAGDGATNFPDALAREDHVPDVFALRKCATTGTLWLGGYDDADAATYVPANSYYDIALHAIDVLGTRVELPTNTVATVDSGGAGLVVPQAAYDALVAQLDRVPRFHTFFGSADAFFRDHSCQAAPVDIVDSLPPITLELDGIAITVPAAQSYAVPLGRFHVCSALTVRSSVSIGDILMRSNVVVFDRARHRIGIAPPTPCPSPAPADPYDLE